jgi:phosphatidylglycerophosphatase A
MRPSSLSRTGELLLTTFGLGKLRPAPGTWGSMPPIALAGLLIMGGFGPNQTLVHWVTWNGIFAAVLVVFSVACVRYGDAAEAKFGKKDPGLICADETAGQCLPLMLLPAHAIVTPGAAIATLLLAFLSFRVLDIIKPWPAFRLQKVPAGWGVLLDDLAAGIQAAIVVQIVTRLAL